MSHGLAGISRRRDFASLASSRRRARSGPVRVVHAPRDESPDPVDHGVGVAYGISRAVGTAVVRNRVRRRLRVLMRECRADDLLPAGHYLVSVRPDAVDAEFGELRHHLRTALADLA